MLFFPSQLPFLSFRCSCNCNCIFCSYKCNCTFFPRKDTNCSRGPSSLICLILDHRLTVHLYDRKTTILPSRQEITDDEPKKSTPSESLIKCALTYTYMTWEPDFIAAVTWYNMTLYLRKLQFLPMHNASPRMHRWYVTFLVEK